MKWCGQTRQAGSIDERQHFAAGLLTAAAALVAGLMTSSARGDEVDFQRDIRPLLSDRCMFCHGPDAHERQAELTFHDRENAMADRDGYRIIDPGKPDSSALIQRVESTDPDVMMPPPESGKTLSAEERTLLRRWVEDGAAWSQHWAYEIPDRPEPPPVQDASWPKNAIDQFVLSRLEHKNWNPSHDADDVTLVRRLYFDLTGLPPTPEDMQACLNDLHQNRCELVVDRLLSSGSYAERMAMYWLDLVRFADTCGYHGDQDHNITPYRDWVIQAYADNMRFDDFTRAQLAGDLLPDSTIQDKVASGYNRLLQTSHEGGVQPKEYLSIYAADRVRNVSAVWLGGTLGCAQCHDHKYDPFTAKDFYSMSAFFADIDEEQHFKVGSNALPTKRPPEIPVLSAADQQRLDQLQEELRKHEALPEGAAAIDGGGTREARIRQLQQQINEVEARRRLTMITVAQAEPRTTRILPRGNWLDDSGPVVVPAVPEFLGTVNSGERERANRLDLANWLTDTEHGSGLLTARVMVNRYWYLLFGRGISPGLADLGGQGQPPTHPELLDWLAVEFAESGWDTRHLMKTIVMSRTYRQSSTDESPMRRARDPNNAYYAFQSSYRLPAETVRDAALAVSGLLVDELGGSSAKPYQPAGYYRHLNFPVREYKANTDRQQYRRGVYVHWQRQFLHPMLKAFDAPSREECTAQRPRSNTPLAALVMLNDPTFVEASRVLADRLIRETGDEADDAQRLERLYQLMLSRRPVEQEAEIMHNLLAISRQRFQDDSDAAAKLIKVGQAPASAYPATEIATWTQVIRALMNSDEFLTRN